MFSIGSHALVKIRDVFSKQTPFVTIKTDLNVNLLSTYALRHIIHPLLTVHFLLYII